MPANPHEINSHFRLPPTFLYVGGTFINVALIEMIDCRAGEAGQSMVSMWPPGAEGDDTVAYLFEGDEADEVKRILGILPPTGGVPPPLGDATGANEDHIREAITRVETMARWAQTFGTVPASGHAFYGWAQDMARRFDVPLLDHLKVWAKGQKWPGIPSQWSDRQIAEGWAYACERIERIPTSVPGPALRPTPARPTTATAAATPKAVPAPVRATAASENGNACEPADDWDFG